MSTWDWVVNNIAARPTEKQLTPYQKEQLSLRRCRQERAAISKCVVQEDPIYGGGIKIKQIQPGVVWRYMRGKNRFFAIGGTTTLYSGTNLETAKEKRWRWEQTKKESKFNRGAL